MCINTYTLLHHKCNKCIYKYVYKDIYEYVFAFVYLSRYRYNAMWASLALRRSFVINLIVAL